MCRELNLAGCGCQSTTARWRPFPCLTRLTNHTYRRSLKKWPKGRKTPSFPRILQVRDHCIASRLLWVVSDGQGHFWSLVAVLWSLGRDPWLKHVEMVCSQRPDLHPHGFVQEWDSPKPKALSSSQMTIRTICISIGLFVNGLNMLKPTTAQLSESFCYARRCQRRQCEHGARALRRLSPSRSAHCTHNEQAIMPFSARHTRTQYIPILLHSAYQTVRLLR